MDFKPIAKTIAIFLCFAFTFLFQGCEKKKDPPPQPKVVSKKIEVDSGGAEKAKGMPAGAASAGVVEPSGTNVTEKIALPEESPAEQGKADAKATDVLAEANDATLLEKKAEDDTAPPDLAAQENSMLTAGFAKISPLYDPSNKIDPFMPLFKDEPEVNAPPADVEKKERKKRMPRTPLERIELSQLKLVGIIQAESGDRGLVQEASGKGYIISKGTYIGTNGGRVTEILRDRVVVEEEVEDVLGKLELEKRELKLQKPFGED